MRENVIRVSDIVEKVYVDFSSIDALKESTGFKKIYTVHTAKTLEISKAIGLHIGGFCDDYGSGGASLAGELSGYDSLPSDLILCLMDDKYNFLPLDEEQLDLLFNYLNGEEPFPSFLNEDAKKFFIERKVKPVLPFWDLTNKSIFFDNYPNVIVIRYEESSLRSEKELYRHGEELFEYSDKLVNKTIDQGDYYLSNDKKYFIKNYRNNNSHYVIIQLINSPKDIPLFDEIIELLNSEDELLDEALSFIKGLDKEEKPHVEEIPVNINVGSLNKNKKEEDNNNPFDWYLIEMDVEASWPNSPDDYSFSSTLVEMNILNFEKFEEKIPLFEGFLNDFELNKKDESVSFTIDYKNKEETHSLSLNEEKTIEFDYTPRKKESRRTGKMNLRFFKINCEDRTIPGKLELKFSYYVDGKIEVEDTKYLNKLNSAVKVGEMVTLDSGNAYGVAFIDEEKDYIVLYSFDADESEDKRTVYIPVNMKTGYKCIEKFTDEGSRCIVMTEIRYIK